MNFYKRHLGDIAKATGHLSQGELGAYDLLLDWLYSNEKPLPLENSDIYRIGRGVTKQEKCNIDRVSKEFFTMTPDGYVQKRALVEMAKASAQAETNRKIAADREAKRRGDFVSPIVEPIVPVSLNESCTNRQPSQTPESRQEQDQQIVADAPAVVKELKRKSKTSLADWIASLPADEPAISLQDPIFKYAADISLPPEFLELAWSWFKENMEGKKQADWRAHFRNAVKGGWPRYWWPVDGVGWKLSPSGEQAKRSMEAEA